MFVIVNTVKKIMFRSLYKATFPATSILEQFVRDAEQGINKLIIKQAKKVKIWNKNNLKSVSNCLI